MVNYQNLNHTFSALSDPTRRAILARLAQGESSVTELSEPFAMSLPAISKHLRVLESAGLLQREKDGRVHRCRLDPKPLKEAALWIEHYRAFWEHSFDALAKYLQDTTEEENSTCKAQVQKPVLQRPGSKSKEPSQHRERRSSRRG